MATKTQLIRANSWFDNSDDANRQFDIKAEVHYSGEGRIITVANGSVKKDDKGIATFSVVNGESPSYQFEPNIAPKQQSEVVLAINAMVTDIAVGLTQKTL